MALGKTKDDILSITGEITFDDIKAAIDYLDKNNVTPRGETSYFLKDGESIGYSLNQIIKTINNDIKKNKTLLKTGEVDTFEVEKIFQNIEFPENYKLIFPWNENGKIQIKKIRNSIIDYAKNLGFELNDEPAAYTAIRYMNRNFAEIHYPDRASKIRVDVFYDRLPQSFRNKFGKKLEKFPDSHKYALNGKFVVTLATKTVEQIKEIIQYSYEHSKEILDKEGKNPIVTDNIETQNTSSNDIIPLNQILYGPPGTGKTYNTIIKAMEIINPNCLEYDERGNVSNYSDVKKEFDKAKDNHQIEFVTFHQSYSYEEFVEGIKPNLEKDSLNYYKSDGIFKKICKNASKNLYKLNNNQKMQQISFDEVIDSFKEKHPEGSDFENLLNISYEENNLIYHFGMQEQDRKIDLLKMEQLFNLNKQYRTSIDFNNEYGGNVSLKGYYHTFYKELLNIKNALEDENQVAIENNKEYVVDENAPKYVLIIDEINRGNISKIFGELITLIEPDKRKGSQYELKVSLPYSPSDELFGVPKNLYIIGTMNTSDRSIASIDIALRRRFKFKEMMPNSSLVADFGIGFNKIFDYLNNKIKLLLDRDHQIGHSYFINTKYNNNNENNNVETLKDIWFSEILPLLNEYFYCDWEKLKLIIPGFIKKLDVPEVLKNECDDSIYEFKTFDEVEYFEKALNQEKFEQV